MEKYRLQAVVLLLFLLVLPFSSGWAQTEKGITMEFQNEQLPSIFKRLEKISSYRVLFTYDELNQYRSTGKVKDASIDQVMQTILAGKPQLKYQIDGRFINVTLQQGRKRIHTLTGVVLDEAGEPLIGATIRNLKTDSGTTTDVDGVFSMPVTDESVNLQISYIGMKPQNVVWRGKALRIVMQEDAQTINEVVVTGYEVIDRRKLTAAITSVRMEDVLMPDMTTIDQALEGHIPDLQFTQNSGEVGATARLRIRGTSTLVGNREPLWVLDGFVLQDPVNVSTEELNDPDYINYVGNAISGINPQDIERIDVLKDAAATALYGTRAANGVIVVTTKKGKQGSPTISYSNTTKFTRRPRYSDKNINLMNSQERVQFGKDLCDLHYSFPRYMPMVGYEGAYNRFQTGKTTYQEFLDEVTLYETVNTDWFKLLCRDAVTHTHTLSLSGGSDKTRYYTSVGYTRENGSVKTEYVDRYTTSMNLNSSLSKRLRLNVSFNANIQKKNHLPSNVAVMNYAYETTRALPALNADGTPFYYQKHGYTVGTGKNNNLYNYNILNEMDNSSSEYSGNTFITNGQLSYKLFDFVDLQLAGSYSRSATLQGVWYGENTNYVAILRNGEVGDMPQTGSAGKCELPYGGVYNTTNTITENLIGRFQAHLHHTFNKKHLITSTIGYEATVYRNNAIADETRGYFKDRGMKYVTMDGTDLDDFPLYKDWLAQGHRRLTADKRNTISGYLTLSYDYKNYFTVGLNGRFDASNKFGSRSNEKFLPVWSVSGRFNIKETLLPKADVINSWNLRMSYGKTGNMLDNETPNLLLTQGTLDAYYGENVSYVSAYPNPNLRWEQTSTTNIGMELSMFEGRLSLTGDAWFKHTTDAFAPISISSVNGRDSYQMNNGTLDNKGYSIYVSGYPVRTKDWSLYLSTGYSYADNTVKSGTNETYTLDDYLNGTAIVNGTAVNTFYSYKYLGLNPQTGIPMFDDYADRRHLLSNKTLAEIIPLVMVESGNRDPKLTGSFYATLKWRQLSMGTSFNYRIGNKVRLFNLYTPVINGVSSDKNVRKEFLDRWMRPGDELHTDIPVLLSPADPNYTSTMSHWCNGLSAKQIDKIPTFASNIWSMYDSSDLRVVPGGYLRLSNLVFTYNFTPRQLRETFLKSLRLNLSVTNVFTIASKKLDGQDPTQAGFASVNLSARPSYTFGINVSF